MLLIAKARMVGTRRSVMGGARTSPCARNSNSAMNVNVVNKMSVFDRRRSGCVAVNGNGNGNFQVKTLNNNMQTVQSRYFSSGMKIDGVQVEVTKSSQNEIETQENRSNDAAKNTDTSTCTGNGSGNGNGGGNGNDESSSESNSNSNSKLKRNEQQKAEEEIYMLNSHVQQHFQNSNYTSALSTSQEVLQKSTDLFGLTHPATASAYNNIGLMHKMMGDFQLSRENYHRALNVYRDVPGIGTDHASYAAALNNLGNLDRAQSAMDDDEGLSSLERMQLNDSAVEYLEEAYKIRKVELGAEHVYTVTSRSNLGGAIAAQVLKQEWMRQKRLMELNKSNADANGTSGNANASDGEKQNEEVWTVSKYTREKWDVAEEHLRAAMRTAVNNPRGERVEIPTSTRTNMNTNTNTNMKDDDNTVKRRDKSLSKKEKQKAAKLRKKQQREERKEAAVAAKTSSSQSTTDGLGLGVGDISICTLSSAAAAQNLAVFLKSRADLVVHSQSQSQAQSMDSGSGSGSLHELDSNDMYAEAKNLYLGALRVRTALKGDNHPDTVASKFSLAELIDAIGDEAGANLLRQQLLDAYQVEEHDGADEGESEEDTKQ